MTASYPLIPREVLFGDPQTTLVRLSPDGKYIGFLSPFKGRLNAWIAPSDSPSTAKAISDSQEPLSNHCWTPHSDYLLYTHDVGGDENWQLYGYHVATGKTLVYTQQKNQAKFLHMSAKSPGKILITLNKRDRHYFDVFELDLATGELNCIYVNNQYWEFIADDDYNLRIGIKINKSDGEYVDLSSGKTLITVSHHDLMGLYFYPRLRLGLSRDNEKLFLAQTTTSNTSSLISISLKNHETQILAHDEQADIFDVLIDPATRTPVAFAINYERKQWVPIHESVKSDFEYLHQLDNGDMSILSQSVNNNEWIVSYIHDDAPVTYYRYYRNAQKAERLFESNQENKNYSYTKMQPHVISMRDGLKCVSYLSQPKQSKSPVPLVLVIHGGPSYRDFWGFNPIHQWLTNRGYAVLSVNYRSSTGFGKAHTQAGYGEWAGKIHEDLLDAVKWAIEKGITTEKQVAIMGRSFGGYATLVGISMTPDVFCCGVDIVGPANLETMVKHLPPYWKPMQALINDMIGTDPTDPGSKEYLRARSPLTYAKQIKKPLLIGHGANDVQIIQSESDQMVKAMQDNQIPVTYAIFPDEGHQFLRPENRMAFYGLAEAFLAKTLKGEVELYDRNTNTSMIVKVDDFGLYPNEQGVVNESVK